MRIRQICAYILMAGSMLLFADASQAQKSSGNTGVIGTPKNSGYTSHGNPPETVRSGPAGSLGEVQTGLPSGRTSSGSLDPLSHIGTVGRIEAPGGLGASGNIGAPGSMGSPNIGGSYGGVIGGQ
jgi:hypothetical protein